MALLAQCRRWSEFHNSKHSSFIMPGRREVAGLDSGGFSGDVARPYPRNLSQLPRRSWPSTIRMAPIRSRAGRLGVVKSDRNGEQWRVRRRIRPVAWVPWIGTEMNPDQENPIKRSRRSLDRHLLVARVSALCGLGVMLAGWNAPWHPLCIIIVVAALAFAHRARQTARIRGPKRRPLIWLGAAMIVLAFAMIFFEVDRDPLALVSAAVGGMVWSYGAGWF